MIFLLVKMFVYLVLAAIVGGGAGWLLRNLQAQKLEEDANRSANDAKSKLPQLESLLRSRDEQVAKYKGQMTDLKSEMKTVQNEHQQAQKTFKEQTRELQRLKANATSAQQVASMSIDDDDVDTAKVEKLTNEMLNLKQQLAQVTQEKNKFAYKAQVAQAHAEQNANGDLQEELNKALWRCRSENNSSKMQLHCLRLNKLRSRT